MSGYEDRLVYASCNNTVGLQGKGRVSEWSSEGWVMTGCVWVVCEGVCVMAVGVPYELG